jgi:arylsulfatase A-like enzyme
MDENGRGPVRKRTDVLAALIVCAGICGQVSEGQVSRGVSRETRAWDGRTNEAIVIVNVDTLRYDSLGVYGYKRGLTPYLDRLATREGVIFDYSYAASDATRASVTSLLTGLYPTHHGFWHLASPLGAIRTRPNIATIVPRSYTTFFVNANPNTAGHFSSDFGHAWSEYPISTSYADSAYYPAEYIFRKAIELLETAHTESNVLLYVQPADPHGPYYPLRRYDDLFKGDTLRNTVTGRYQTPLADLRWDEHLASRTPAELRNLRNRYDAEVRYLDEEFAKFDTYLKRKYPRRVLIFTSDHGESFLDHGDASHGTSLYDEQIRVPLIVVDPAQRFGRPRRIGVPISSVDLLPTVAELVGVATPPGRDGLSILEILRRHEGLLPLTKERVIVSEVVQSSLTLDVVPTKDAKRVKMRTFLEKNPVNALIRATISYRKTPWSREVYKLIENESPYPTRVLMEAGLLFQPHWHELYRIDGESKESHNEFGDAAKATEIASRSPLKGVFPEFQKSDVKLSKEQVEQLRSLGYLH